METSKENDNKTIILASSIINEEPKDTGIGKEQIAPECYYC